VSPATTGGWIGNYVGIADLTTERHFIRVAAQQNSVEECAATHDVNASDFGWANLERSCHGPDR
jgi:hypothetical protein